MLLRVRCLEWLFIDWDCVRWARRPGYTGIEGPLLSKLKYSNTCKFGLYNYGHSIHWSISHAPTISEIDSQRYDFNGSMVRERSLNYGFYGPFMISMAFSMVFPWVSMVPMVQKRVNSIINTWHDFYRNKNTGTVVYIFSINNLGHINTKS